MKKELKGEKKHVYYRNNKEVQKLVQQNTEMKEQFAESEERHRRNSLQVMSIKEKVKE